MNRTANLPACRLLRARRDGTINGYMNKLIVMDIFCALSSPSFDVRRKVLDICLPQKRGGSVEPLKTHTVVTRRKVVAGYSGPDATAPSLEGLTSSSVRKL